MVVVSHNGARDVMPSVCGVAVAMGLLLSPDTFIFLGNQLGSVGLAFLGAMVCAGALAMATASSTAALGRWFPGPGGEARGLQQALGTLPAMVLPLCARVLVLVCASTGTLAIAGYVFNEVFVTWFPNLGFSFCLLGLLLALNLWGPRVAHGVQLLCVMTVLGGLVGLTAMAVLDGRLAFPIGAAVRPAPAVLLHGVLGGLWLFIGMDLVRFTPLSPGGVGPPLNRVMILGILLAGMMSCTWGLVSLGTVPTATLASSTVPHMATARALGGQTGRVVMGLVVLAGVGGAVNALLFGVSRMLVSMASVGLLPAVLARAPQRAPVALVLLALGPALMMRLGMAGEPETELYTRAGLVFWLLHYSAVHLAILVLGRHAAVSPPRRASSLIPGVSLAVLGLGSVGLICLDSTPGHLVHFMLTVGASVAGLSLGWMGWCRWKGRARQRAAAPYGEG